ncbi:unnamed protein product [Heterobilharzia americana]|nr:unnamed protein product [Heterobilharzia americana]
MSNDTSINISTSIIIIFESILGALFNILAIIIVFTVHFGSKLTTIMLRAQTIFDFNACFLTAIYYITQIIGQYNKITGLYIIDLLICHLWFRNSLFWLMCILSVQNLVCISVDRVSSVIFLQLYKVYTNRFIIIYIIYLIIMILILYTPSPLLRRYVNNHCEMHFSFSWLKTDILLDFIVYTWIIFAYIIPVIIMISSHVWVIHIIKYSTLLKHNIIIQKFHTNSYIKRKIIQLVITTAIMSGQQIVLHFFECITQILIICNIIEYQYETVIGQMGTLLIILSCLLNPCVLIFTTIKLRKRLWIFIKKILDKIKKM